MDPKHSHGPDRVDYQELPGDLTEVHAAIEREHPEPTAESTPVPMWLIATCGFAVLWAGIYMGVFNGGLKGDVFNELNATAGLLFPVPTKGTGPGAGETKEASLAEQGKAVYANCATCHQPTGLGAPGQFPPLAKTEFVAGEKRLVAIILKGLQGPITVNGAQFNGAMPPWEGALNNKKIAAVASYVRSSFGNSAPEISEAKVAAGRAEFSKQTSPWTADQILQIPVDAVLEGGDAAPAGGATPPAAAAPAAGSTPPAGTAPTAGAPAAPGATTAAAPAPGAPPAPTTAGAPAAGTPPAAPPAPGAGAPAPANVAAATPEQLEEGKKVYMTVCFACHQPTGLGLPMVFPPLAKTPYVNGTPERLIAMVLKGNVGPMTVDGKPFNNVMPGQELMLDDAKIAAVTTYVRASFGNNAPPISADQVAVARKKFADRKTMWTQAELDAWKE